MKITIVGPYPPPYGGISVHIKRMKLFLEKHGVNVIIYNESNSDIVCEKNVRGMKYRYFLLKVPFLKTDIIHFHSINKNVRMLLGFYKIFRKKIILTIHGDSLINQIKSSNIVERTILLKSLKKIDGIVCVNPLTKKQLIGYGMPEKKLHVIPAHINPIERLGDSEAIPKNVWEFINKNKSNFLISANGWIRRYNNEDLYGLDMIVELVKKLNERNIKVFVIFALLGKEQQSKEEREYYEKLKQDINKYQLQDQIYIYEATCTEFYPILKESHLFVRPTNTDGFGVSIAEALYFNIPAIASDVCKRPDGTILFKNRDNEDFFNKVVYVINNYQEVKKAVSNIQKVDNANNLFDLYSNLISYS